MSRRDESERLERALDGGPVPHDEDVRRMVAGAGALKPGSRRSPSRVRFTREAMLREYERAQNPQDVREDAGTGDGLEEVEIHRQEVELPGGGRVVLADIEAITPERAEKTAAYIARVLQDSEQKDRQS
ncbi:hypothetical protein [Streptomyces sp. BH055]|uniref:hypothetical protein n=1 Tax=unclassified Streptomyces TaxID=2593676 RepID=UPI003BB504C8